MSKKRRAREAEAAPIRLQLRKTVGRCEFCLKPRLSRLLANHEICNGPLRQAALDKPYAQLIVCLEPWGKPPCHQTVQNWSEVKQLALLYLVSTRYDLVAYLALTNPRAPNRILQSEVDLEIRFLTTRSAIH